jgi:hypothetical protein
MLLSYMIVRANPLNDITDPRSEMNEFHAVNLKDRRKFEAARMEEEFMQNESGRPIVLWPDIWPFLCPTVVMIGYEIVVGLLRVILTQ